MDAVRRVILFLLGVFLLIYAMTVHPVQITLVIVALMLMGVITWEQITAMIGRNGHDKEITHER